MLFLLLIGCQTDEAIITASIEGKWKGTLAEIQIKPSKQKALRR